MNNQQKGTSFRGVTTFFLECIHVSTLSIAPPRVAHLCKILHDRPQFIKSYLSTAICVMQCHFANVIFNSMFKPFPLSESNHKKQCVQTSIKLTIRPLLSFVVKSSQGDCLLSKFDGEKWLPNEVCNKPDQSNKT